MSSAARRLVPRSVAALDGARRLSTDPTLRVGRSRFDRWITRSGGSPHGTGLRLAGAATTIQERNLIRATRVLISKS